MTFLAKLGSILARGIAILTGMSPLLASVFGAKTGNVGNTIANDLTAVGGIVLNVEAVLGAGTGPEKLAKAAPLVANIVKASELISGHKIVNDTLFAQGVTDLTNAVAEILNSLDGGNVQSNGQPVVATKPTPIPAALVASAS